MKKKLYIYVCFVSLFLMSFPALAQNAFFETLYDVPVMQGFEELPDKALSFDKPSGRVAEAGALTLDNAETVLSFYKTALLQMGWGILAENSDTISFQRENEVLEVSYEKSTTSEGAKALVAFKLAPSSK